MIGFTAVRHRLGQRRVGGFVGQIFLTGEEAQKRPSFTRNLIADSAAERRVTRLQCIQHAAARYRSVHFNRHLSTGAGQVAQMMRDGDADYGNVCTSTESILGSVLAIAVHESPLSAEA